MEISKVSQDGLAQSKSVNSTELRKTEQIKNLENSFNTASTMKEPGEEKLKKENVEIAVDKLNKFLLGEKVHAEYEVHEKLNHIMIRIVNNDTKEVVLEIPPKKILDMVAKMCEMVGILVDKRA